MTLWEFRHLNELQVNKKGLRFRCWICFILLHRKLSGFTCAPLCGVNGVHLDMASRETPFPSVHSNLQT